jgi:Tfp pilus assembly protein PilW
MSNSFFIALTLGMVVVSGVGSLVLLNYFM